MKFKAKREDLRKVDFTRMFVESEEMAVQTLNALAIAKNVRAVDSVEVGNYVTLLGPDAKALNAFVAFVKMA